MLLKHRYDYPTLTRVKNAQGKRQYVAGTGDQPVPSVTTILDRTADKSHLHEWKKRVGAAEAQRQTTQAAGFGTMVHNSLEKYILGEPWEITGNNLVHVMARRGVKNMIEQGLVNAQEIWGVEVGLIAPEIYAGTTDSVGIYKGKPSIIDYKTSKQIKKREWISDFFMQGCAYALAHNEMFGTDIQQVAILMVDREGNFLDFIIEGDEFVYFSEQWAKRVGMYYGY